MLLHSRHDDSNMSGRTDASLEQQRLCDDQSSRAMHAGKQSGMDVTRYLQVHQQEHTKSECRSLSMTKEHKCGCSLYVSRGCWKLGRMTGSLAPGEEDSFGLYPKAAES